MTPIPPAPESTSADGTGDAGASSPSRRSVLGAMLFGSALAGAGTALGTKALLDRGPERPTGARVSVYGGDDFNDARANALRVWQATPRNAGLAATYVSVGTTSTDQISAIQNLLATKSTTTDLVVIDPEYLPGLVDTALVQPLDHITGTSLRAIGCFPHLVGRCEVPAGKNGRVYAVPLNADSPMLVADLSLLPQKDQAGWERLRSVSAPKTFWSAVNTMARRSVGPPASRRWLIEAGDYEGMTVCLIELICAYGGGRIDIDPSLKLAQNRQALEAMRSLPRNLFALPFGNGDEGAVLTAVQNHQAAFARLWPAQVHELTTGNGTDEATAGQYAAIPIPGGVLGGQVVALAARSGHAEAARDLASYLAQPLSQLQMFHGGGYVPTVEQMYADPQVQNDLGGLNRNLAQPTLRPSLRDYIGWSQQFRSSVRAYLLGDGTDVETSVTKPLQGFLD